MSESAGRLVVSCGHSAAADYAALATERSGRRVVVCDGKEGPAEPAAEVVLFLGRRLTETDRRRIDDLSNAADRQRFRAVCIVGTALAHLGDEDALAAERYAVEALRRVADRVVVFRVGFVFSPRSVVTARLTRAAWLAPLVPKRIAGWFLDVDELYAAIEREFNEPTRGRFRTFALLGPRRPLRDVLEERSRRRWQHAVPGAAARLLSFLLAGQFVEAIVRLVAGRRPAVRAFTLAGLQPQTFAELLALCNRHNSRHVKVVGYNNGVVHFGHRHPGRTIVSTVGCDRASLLPGDRLKADCGVTVSRAMQLLDGHDRELRVVPNYSYVCLGTAFFVPIHGSSNDCCTLAESIDLVTLYDPATDRVSIVRPGDATFGRLLYQAGGDELLLRLRLRVRRKSGYRLARTVLTRPSSVEVLQAFRDAEASNVEIRKAKGSSDAVEVFRYFAEGRGAESGALDLPRDDVGRIWDRLEQNPITSAAFHGLVRRFVFHTELFLTEAQFVAFWNTHRDLPVRKVQLRRMHETGLPHSPFGRERFVSADLFTLRRHRAAFERHLVDHVGEVKTNPGKHTF